MSRAMQFDIVANDKATPNMGKVEKSMEGFGKRLSASFATTAAKAMALYAALQRIGEWVNRQGDIADEAAKLGLSPEKYEKLRFAAADYGMEVSQVAMALKDVNKLLDEAATKGGPSAEALKALGFSESEIVGRTVKQEEVMARMAEVIKEARSEEEKFALATRVVGDRVAQSIVPILSDYENFLKLQENLQTVTNENAIAFDALGTKISVAGQNTSAFFSNLVGWSAKKLGILTPEDMAKPERTDEQRRRAQEMRDKVLAADAVGAGKGKVSPESLSLAAIGGASAQVLRGIGMKSPEQETAENTRRLVELATAPAPAAGTPTGVSRAFTEGVSDMQKVYQAHPMQYKRVPFRIDAPSTR